MNDTSTEVQARFRTLMLERSPAQRLAMACRMFATAKALVRVGILEAYAPKEPDQMREHIFLRLYGKDFSETEKAKILNSWKTVKGKSRRRNADASSNP